LRNGTAAIVMKDRAFADGFVNGQFRPED